MKILSLFLTIIVLFSFVCGNSAEAESWRNVSKGNRHMAIYKNSTFVEFNPKNNTWYLGFGLEKNADVSQPMVTLTAPNGASTLFRINTDLTVVRDNLEAGIKTLVFPIDENILEYLQANSNIIVQLGDVKYASPLTGSRKAISTAMKRVAHDAAVADDEQHTIDQAESDSAQAIARNERAVPLGGVQHWAYRGKKNVGTVAESYEAAASVDDDIMSLVYFPHDDAFSLWFTLNGNKSLSYKHADRAEIFIRTRKVSGGGRYESDYVFKGHTVAQPDQNPTQPQFVVASLTSEDIRALRQYDGMDIGAGYFLGEDWKTYRLSGKDLWKSFVALAVAANRTDLLQ